MTDTDLFQRVRQYIPSLEQMLTRVDKDNLEQHAFNPPDAPIRNLETRPPKYYASVLAPT